MTDKQLREEIEKILGGHETSGCCDDGCDKWDYFGGRYVLTKRKCTCGFEEKLDQLLTLTQRYAKELGNIEK